MNELSKQQLILLALLVSFVTSMATGIVTVSLMDQAPKGVTQTINQVIERTIQTASSNSSDNTASVGSESSIAIVIDVVSKSIVKIKSRNSDFVTGTGLIVSPKGVVMTDKKTISQLSDYEMLTSTGTHVPLTVIQSQDNGNIVFLIPTGNSSRIAFTSSVRDRTVTLGQDVLSISGTSTQVLGHGIITATDSDLSNFITTNIPDSKLSFASPLFNIKGEIIGVNIGDKTEGSDSVFYSSKSLLEVIPKF